MSDTRAPAVDTDLPRDPRPRVPVWARDVLCVLVVVGTCFASNPREPYVAPSPVIVGLAALSAAVLLLRRRWALPVVAATVALFLAGIVIERGQNVGLEFAVAIAVFGVSARLGRRAGLPTTIIAIVVTVIPTMVVMGTVFDPRITQLVFTLAFAGAGGDATRQHRDFIAALADRADRAERTREEEARRRVAEERLRIARDLHDAVAHEISVISLNAGVASQTVDADPAQAKESLAIVRRAARAVLAEIGDLMELLRSTDATPTPTATSTPTSTPQSEGARAPQPGVDRIDGLVSRFGQSGLAVGVRIEGDLSRVPPATGRVAYRVVQEGLTNAHKHGDGGRAHLLLAVGDDDLTVVVTNPVRAADRTPQQAGAHGAHEARSGFGLIGLREQVASVRGTVETGSAPGGWRVAARLPIDAQRVPIPDRTTPR
ncbi:sensor histidine kinase [Microbacterium sp.]|uniref:sensor histidine kinase n=1 Tax=Microbacterium sp. TaxID=51671 RepID=UPI003C707F94